MGFRMRVTSTKAINKGTGNNIRETFMTQKNESGRAPDQRGAPDMETDSDRQETAEWIDALEAVIASAGPQRARFLLSRLSAAAQKAGVRWRDARNTPYVNTIRPEDEPPFPGGADALALEERLAGLMRWNALAMVVRANRSSAELGGHIASYASAADLFEVGFNHFFRARTEDFAGDLVYFQAHSAPGVYARAWLEGDLDERQLDLYRQEIEAARQGLAGLSSYPHPWLMPNFWQFPTGSMGLGPISAIYQARFMRYLEHRGLISAPAGRPTDPVAGSTDDACADTGANAKAGNDTAGDENREVSGNPAMNPGRKVWGVFGDGEMDEPESLAALGLAARESLDNLVFVINCNLQRLDGPVRGNGHIVDELETLFAGAGWNVIKLLWGADWDPLFARDTGGELVQTLNDTVDGQLQTFAANDGAFNRTHFFNQSPALQAIGARLTDEEIDRLRRGGHDMKKIHAAYQAAASHTGAPTVILAQTKKGFGMGSAGQGRMTTHQHKKFETGALLEFRDRFGLPIPDEDCEALAFHKPAPGSAEMRHLRQRRAALGGFLPRRSVSRERLAVPAIASWAGFALAPEGRDMSTTMALVRMLGGLLKDASLGRRIVPIVADEARTFGMANLFAPIPRKASSTSRKTSARSSPTGKRKMARSSRKASRRPARSRPGRRRPRVIRCTACRCCRSTSIIRCSVSSVSAT
jgi:pyruvate dehydrogenase E1 component